MSFKVNKIYEKYSLDDFIILANKCGHNALESSAKAAYPNAQEDEMIILLHNSAYWNPVQRLAQNHEVMTFLLKEGCDISFNEFFVIKKDNKIISKNENLNVAIVDAAIILWAR